ncbi:NAD(P)-dependent dehydrogenase (short-subunit alcohol dehydrogenase family) [Rhodanobacter sp. ANJX3]|uniref:SDR family oxidoreductase n=1 Tax=Rhodanobacter sp. ANJX3 TaxID=2723083 RepID=UPI0016124215|nr:SDR family oxidoreductase [Rhodanobacter sp. ANJX3]MBB5360428.1 NAD(P)-dependent dehydrogenase (short-subunit alcohol dehydrogenase family) [Rhodanobacter sp. ANJX3]
MNTVLITGCSSGFGVEIARYFLDRDWQVIATMRTPRDDVLPRSERLRVLPLDITDAQSIQQLVEVAGPIDVLVNNAGFGAGSPVELTPMATARELFETNTFGTLAMTQAFLPQFRQRGAGVIVNVTSSVTLKALPLIGIYSASKAAVNAFTASLAAEVEPFGVRVRLVLPGRAPETRFGDNASTRLHGMHHEAYADLAASVLARMRDESGPVTYSSDVAEAVWRAATDPSTPLRIPAGEDAVAWANGG